MGSRFFVERPGFDLVAHGCLVIGHILGPQAAHRAMRAACSSGPTLRQRSPCASWPGSLQKMPAALLSPRASPERWQSAAVRPGRSSQCARKWCSRSSPPPTLERKGFLLHPQQREPVRRLGQCRTRGDSEQPCGQQKGVAAAQQGHLQGHRKAPGPIARIAQQRPLDQIDDEAAQRAAQALRSWFTDVFLHAEADVEDDLAR